MSPKSFKGFVWPVTREKGLRVFENTSTYYEYGYSRPRFPEEGDVLFFYFGRLLIGSVPVTRRAWLVDEAHGRHAGWRNNWKYAVGLSFDRKTRFDRPIPIEQLVGICRVLDGKTGRQLHDSFRMAPILSFEECLLLLEMASPLYRISKFSKELTPAENCDWNDDLSNSLKGRNIPLERVKHVFSVFKRNQRLIKELKEEYDGICQICGIDNMIETDSGEFYTEGHHLTPLGEAGSDDLGNVVILCPLCHKKLHYSRDRNLIKEIILYSDRHRRIIERFGRE